MGWSEEQSGRVSEQCTQTLAGPDATVYALFARTNTCKYADGNFRPALILHTSSAKFIPVASAPRLLHAVSIQAHAEV